MLKVKWTINGLVLIYHTLMSCLTAFGCYQISYAAYERKGLSKNTVFMNCSVYR